jgi:uncharacterized protein YndB with AHSA1/START domain
MSALANPLPIAERELVVSRKFDAPRELVWQAWTDPKHAIHWWGPPMCQAAEMHMDLRVGGKFRHRLKSAEDGSALWLHGVFREIVPPERLVFTFAWENNPHVEFPHADTLVTITFDDEGGKTLITLRQRGFHSLADLEGHGQGWTGTFDRFEIYAAQMSASGA